ncbi:PLC-like phosphodiesterase [Pleurotus eryngii]|uniref:PLC-like phosphodiesterase n=1 Tax=Pleurotus eryngii TaxID=5323 RepID=A0A9P6DEM9_PLEER|nr:PLC-like phosphodiesterase [Pleurotus eryngii]
MLRLASMSSTPFVIVLLISWLEDVSLALPVTKDAVKRATQCNGHEELCDRSYGNITFLGAHDSFASSKDPLALARDQEVGITTQLELGVRLLQAQSHMKNGTLHFCHTSCTLFDGGTVLSYLKTVKAFLDGHPNEVLTLLFTNPEGVSVAGAWKNVFDNAGLTELIYTPSPADVPIKRDDWPTLGSMITSGRRLVVFLDAGADPTQIATILPEFAMIWETPFSVTDPAFPCSVNRIHGPLQVEDHMYLINHSLNVNIIPVGEGVIVSDPFEAGTTNSVTSIRANVDLCAPLAGDRAPNFILLDFVNRGEGLRAIDLLNGFE